MNQKTHRHFVAFPLTVFLMLAVAGVQAALPGTSADLTGAATVKFGATSTPVNFQVGWLLAGTLGHDSLLRTDKSGEHSVLVRGQVLMRSQGLTELSIGTQTKIRALSASYVALHDGTTTTVVPLTAPIIVSRGDKVSIAVPGMQVVIDKTGALQSATVPQDWYTERVQALKLLKDVSIMDVSDSSRDLKHASLSRLIKDGRITADTFLKASALAHDIDPSGMALRLLYLRLLQEEPRTDDDVSEALSTKISEDRLLSSEMVFTLPLLVATLMKPVAEPHIELWQKSAVSLGLVDISSALSLVHRFAGFPEQLERAGYPQQSFLWQRALSSVASVLSTTLSGQALADLQADQAVITRGDHPSEQTQKTDAVSPGTMTNWSEQQLTSLVQSMLFSHGALMAVTTTLVPDTVTQTVRVSSVFIAVQGIDVPFEFTIDV